MKNLNRIILPVTATALVFGVSNCKKSENDTQRLVGQWEVTEADGDIAELFESDEYDYVMNLEFHLAGDAEFCKLAESYKSCVVGEWEWEGAGNDELSMTFESDVTSVTISIDTFEGDEITGEMTVETEDGEEKVGDITLERVYIDKSALVDLEKK